MKLFLALSTGAMISAGIYGLVDLSTDLRDGTMIVYHGQEGSTGEVPAGGQARRLPAINAAQRSGTAHNMPDVKPPKLVDVSSFFIDVTEIYSRASPELYLPLDISPVIALLPDSASADSAATLAAEVPATVSTSAPDTAALSASSAENPESRRGFTLRPRRAKAPGPPHADSLKIASDRH